MGSTESSLYWVRMQSMLDAERKGKHGDSPGSSFSDGSEYTIGRPRTPTVYNEQGQWFSQNGAGNILVPLDVAKTAELEQKNTQLEDRIAEPERKLLELAAQKRE